MTDHEIGMAPIVKGLDNQCAHWKQVASDLMIEVQELKAQLQEAVELLFSAGNRIDPEVPLEQDIERFLEKVRK